MPVGLDGEIIHYLERIQSGLEFQNGVTRQASVVDFLIDHDERNALPGSNPASSEQVFVREGAEIGLGVYIAEDVLTRISTAPNGTPALGSPAERQELSSQWLDDYCVATEGVSHFIYLMERAQRDQKVTLLELELQAEVDKFVQLSRELSLAPGSVAHSVLIDRLFGHYELHANLSDDEMHRYDAAAKLAARFCHRMTKRMKHSRSTSVMIKDARDFFDSPLEEKIRRSGGLV